MFNHNNFTFKSGVVYMEFSEAVKLIKTDKIVFPGITHWADLGCGSGLFTRALASLLNSGSIIHAIDKNKSIRESENAGQQVDVRFRKSDFLKDEINLTALNGILMANSLHFVKEKIAFLKKIKKCLLPTGLLLIVEYDTDRANPYVPYPISFLNLQDIFIQSGFTNINKMNEQPSIYNSGKIYSAIAGQH